MVSESIDIHNLTLEELDGVVDLYPWFAGARKELCARMKELGALSSGRISEAFIHMPSRRVLFDIVYGKTCREEKAVDPGLLKAVRRNGSDSGRKVAVVGGDYFSQADYSSVRQSDDNIFHRFTSRGSGQEDRAAENWTGTDNFCTETLAGILAEQGYLSEAKSIYSKLILRYPEKSVYFASLIEELDKIN